MFVLRREHWTETDVENHQPGKFSGLVGNSVGLKPNGGLET